MSAPGSVSCWCPRAGAVLLVLLSSGCRERELPQPEQRGTPLADVSPSPSPPLVTLDPCRAKIDAVEHELAWPGDPELERLRVEILGRARSVPVVFSRPPRPPELDVPSPGEPDPSSNWRRVESARQELVQSKDPADTIFQILKRTRRDFPTRRAIFLSEGYVHANQPLLALRLSQVLRLDHLFDAADVFVQRGAERKRARRQEGKYYWLDGAGQIGSQEANLLLFDRVAQDEAALARPLHADFSALRRELAFDRASIVRMTERGWVVRLETAELDSLALLDIEDGEARLVCESPAPSPELVQARSLSKRRAALIEPILAAAHDIVARRLPFDEPRTEEGQQDGHLRIAFRRAYRNYEHTYEFNGDRYFVFDGFGRPLLPQVCIDFITDSIEWGTGGRWASRGERREHVSGAIDFSSFGLENARSIERVAEFGADHPAWFDTVFLPDEERIKFVYRARFFEDIAKRGLFHQRGDIVFILGLRDDERFHYHSFFVDEVDPLTGAPILLASNAGPPQIRTWEGEMQNAPLRSILARVRLRTSLLEAAAEQARTKPGVPLELPREPREIVP